MTDRALGDYVEKGGWYTLWVMLALTLFGFVDRQVLTLAAAPMAASLHLSDSQIGMVQGLAFAIFSAIVLYPIAWVADRCDRRIVLTGCVVVWSVGTAACGLARNFEELFLAAVAIAAGEAGIAPIVGSFVPELFKGRKRVLANGLIYVFAYAGIAAGLALGGGALGWIDEVHESLPPALRAFESWQLAFFLVALPAPIFPLLLLFTPLGRRASPVTAAVSSGRAFWPFLREHWRAIVPVFGGLGLYMLAFGGYFVWLPIAGSRLFGMTPAYNGAAMGAATLFGVAGGVGAGTFVVRRMIVRLGPVATTRFFRLAMLAATPVLFAFPFVGAAWQLFTLFALLMLAGTAIGCMVPTLLQDMAPPELRARLFAIWGIASGLLGGAAPTLVGWVSDALGSGPRLLLTAMSLVAIPSWIGAILLFRLAERPLALFIHLIADQERVSEE